MTLTARERTLAILTGILVGGLVLYLAVDRWFLPAYRRTGERIAKAERDLEVLQAAADILEERRAQYRRSVALALHHKSTEDAELFFLNQLNALARRAGMSPPNIRALSPRHEDFYDLIQFNLQVRCTFEQFLAFLKAFYDQPGAHRIDSVTVKPGGKYRSPEGTLSVTMVLSAVVIPEEGKESPAGGGGGA